MCAQLPEGPGKEETEKLCKGCHELERSVSRRQDRDGWQLTLNKMVALGTKGTDKELAVILDYLSKNYPAGEVPPINVNEASAIELESRLSLRRSQAAAVIAYREKNGKLIRLIVVASFWEPGRCRRGRGCRSHAMRHEPVSGIGGTQG